MFEMSFEVGSPPSSKPPKPDVQSNFQSFLNSVTPLVPSKILPMSCLHDENNSSHPIDKDELKNFTLFDFWQCYEEWSVYGASVPVVLNNGENVVQYYTPYLSAIQIYTIKPSSTVRSPRGTQCEIQSLMAESESGNLSRSSSTNSSRTTWDSMSDSSNEHEASSPVKDPLGYLYFQYCETNSPFWRAPLTEKVSEFVQNFPGLFTLKNVDLSPASWISVAWYPIYHIPTKGDVKDLGTCFLTFHTLSSFTQGESDGEYIGIEREIECSEESEEVEESEFKEEKGDGLHVSIPPFGLASYRMQGDVWLNNDPCDLEKMVVLYSAADSWLKQLGFWHHDFDFFTTHSTNLAL